MEKSLNLKTAEQLFAQSDSPAYRIDLGMLHFLQHETFLGHILMRCILVENPSVGTMGVTVQNARMYLYYAPEFVQKMKWKGMLAVLEHEVLHLLHLHITRCKNRHPRRRFPVPKAPLGFPKPNHRRWGQPHKPRLRTIHYPQVSREHYPGPGLGQKTPE